MKCHY
ncbi:Protein of unknown function [Pyronema omphalodes CBS 100304]